MANNKKNDKKQKTDWFEALCSIGESDEATKTSRSRSGGSRSTSAAKGDSSRTRVQSRSDSPFDDKDIPPFDPEEESVADTIFGEEKSSVRATAPKRPRAAQGNGAAAKKGGKGASSTRTDKGTRREQQPVAEPRRVADVVYFLQPYVVFVLGAFLVIEMLLSFAMSGGDYGWTRDTQPFRWVGYYLEYLLFGVLGHGAYLLPALMMYLSFDRLRRGRGRSIKGIMAAGIVLLLPAIIHVCQINAGVAGVPNTMQIGELYTTGAAHMSAGVIPGLLAYIFNVGLGVIGTLIVGIFLLILLTALLFGLTPGAVWEKLRGVLQQRKENKDKARDREIEMRQERGLAPSEALLRGTMAPEERAAAEMDHRIARKLDREQEKLAQQALREADRSDRMEEAKDAKGGKRRTKVSSEEDAEFEPIDMLIRRERGQGSDKAADGEAVAAPKEKKEKTKRVKKEDPAAQVVPAEQVATDEMQPVDPTDELPDEDAPTMIFGEVSDLPEEEDPAFSKKAREVKPIPVQETPDAAEETLTEELSVYPTQAEIELDMDEPLPEDDELEALFTGGVSERQLNENEADGGAGEILPADLGEIYEELEDIDSDDADDDGLLTLQGDGGVTIKIDALSDAERQRGAVILPPADKEEYAKVRPYTFPKIDLLNPEPEDGGVTEAMLQQKAIRLRDTLNSFNVRVESVTYVGGPTVTRYEVKPAPGVKVASITRLSDDIAMGLEASGAVRIEAPIPGKNAVGIEVPNDKRSTVYLRGLIDCDAFRTAKSRVTCCLGEGVGGVSVYLNIEKMPHLLIAGATGTGKSVCINSLIMSLLYKAKPDEVKLLMIDPKTVEFSVYKDIPHLMAPIITDSKRAAGALNLAVQEMERRYELMRTVGVRNIAGYNAATENDRYEHPYIPQMVIIIDELADLMMTAKNEVEASIVRLAQKARAAGIHLILGTQRPSVDVITGLIKANVPSRISFTVTSQVDSRTILDNAGAEKLLGIGDMLYAPIGSSKPQRVQGCFVSDEEVEKIVEYIRRNNDEVRYDQNFLDNLDREAELIGNKRESRDEYDDDGEGSGELDPKFYEALGIAVKNKRISTSLLQRAISIGYGRAAKILDQMEEKGFIGPASGNKPREILISEDAYRELMVNKD